MHLWLNKLRNQRVIFYYDNNVYIYNLQKSFIRKSTMTFLRDIIILMIKYNIIIIFIWILIKVNQLINNLL